MRDDLKKMEDDLKRKEKNEDDLKKIKKWKTTNQLKST